MDRWPPERIQDLADMVKVLAPLATQVAVHDARIDQLRDNDGELKALILSVDKKVDSVITSLGEDKRSKTLARIGAWAQITTGLIGAVAIIVVAVVPH